MEFRPAEHPMLAAMADFDFIRERREGPVFIAGNGISEDTVRQKLTTEGWTNVLINHEGRLYEAP
jgi:hypothetical protein